VGLPIIMAEIVLGRRSQLNPVGAFRVLGRGRPGGRFWTLVGMMGVSAGFIILSYYSVVAGWTLRYIVMAASGHLGELANHPETLQNFFGSYLADGSAQTLGQGVFMAMTIGAVVCGVKAGIERVARVLMPLAIYATTTSGFGDAMRFLFRPNFGDLTSRSLLEALGQAFFSLSLGMGAILTYGSYMRKEDSIPKSAAQIATLDTAVGIIASIIMFSIIFSFDFEVSASSGILFTTLPTVFYQLPGGSLIATFFYLLVAFAALTSTISLMEVVSSCAIDELGWSRRRAVLTLGGGIFAFGVLNALSMGGNEALSNLNVFGKESARGVFGTLDYLSANWLLPVGGLLIALFTGWALPGRDTREEIEQGHGSARSIYAGWRFLIRFAAPLAVGAIIVSVIFGAEYQ